VKEASTVHLHFLRMRLQSTTPVAVPAVRHHAEAYRSHRKAALGRTRLRALLGRPSYYNADAALHVRILKAEEYLIQGINDITMS